MDSRKFLSAEERTAFDAWLTARLDTDLRNACMFLTAMHTGTRASELLGLQWTDINTETGAVYIRTLKGGANRETVVPKALRLALKRLKLQSHERPFPISYPRLAALWLEYRPAPKPMHCLRHTFAMHAYERTKDLRFVQYALGHRSIQNTMVYATYQYTASEFKKLMKVR